MNKIKNAKQLESEIVRLKALAKIQEQQLREDVKELKEEYRPENLLMHGIASVTGIQFDKKDFFKEGLAYTLSLIIQRFVLKTEKKIEDRAYEFVDSLFEKIKRLLDKFTSHDARREERRESKQP